MADFGGDSFVLFLSTPSARRATAVTQTGSVTSVNFYPRPPRGGRRASTARRLSFMQFLSTPSARRATRTSCTRSLPMRFLSTPSARRATDEQFVLLLSHGISIHALREEGDPGLVRHHPYDHISIHALREEGDIAIIVEVIFEPDFYPRPPRGGRLSAVRLRMVVLVISIHALREEGDLRQHKILAAAEISIHALREEGDPTRPVTPPPLESFLSTPSARRATAIWCVTGCAF